MGIELDDNLMRVHKTKYYSKLESKLMYNAYHGLFMESLRLGEGPNEYYHLVNCNGDDDFLYEWKAIGNQFGIVDRSLMCNLNQDIFFCNQQFGNYLYNFENATWQGLPRSMNKDMAQMKDLYFDSVKQRVFATAVVSNGLKMKRRICFEYFSTTKHKWYRHPALHIMTNGANIHCKTWQD